MTFTPQSSLFKMLLETAKAYPDQNALVSFQSGRWVPMTYQKLCHRSLVVAQFLKGIGISKGDRIGILISNCPEWVILDQAAYALGVIVVPIYATLSEPDIHYIIQDSALKVIAVETSQQLEMVCRIRSQCESLEAVIALSQKENDLAHHIHAFSLIEGTALDVIETDSVKADDLASIVYTSGTTGNPKGVMLTHGNFISNINGILSVYRISTTDSALSFLPLSHVFERTAGYYTLIAAGATIYYAQNYQTVSQDLQSVKPTLMVSVPRLYEKIYEKIMSQATGLKKWLLQCAIMIGQDKGVFSMFANVLVFRRILAKTGGRLRFCISGGAPLARHLYDFFLAMGLPILEGYGQTESSPVIACNTETNHRAGTVGKVLPNVTVNIADDGELVAYGPNIMKGYWNNPEKTKETLTKDGGLLTGDIVTMDADGYIAIVDRKKELIVLSNGKNVAPQRIESAVLKSRYIDQVMVVGDEKKFVSALIIPSETMVWSDDKEQLIHSELEKYQSALSPYEKVKKFTLLNTSFTQEGGELTPTLKLKRRFISKKYADIIEKMYKNDILKDESHSKVS